MMETTIARLMWKEFIDGKNLYYRAISFSTPNQAIRKEAEQLANHYYEWNTLNNSDPLKRFLVGSYGRIRKEDKITLRIYGPVD
jgi:hypothetical protein